MASRSLSANELAELRCRTTCTVREAARVLGIGVGLAYELARSGELAPGAPVLKLGRRLVVPTRPLFRLVDGDGAASSAGRGADPAAPSPALPPAWPSHAPRRPQAEGTDAFSAGGASGCDVLPRRSTRLTAQPCGQESSPLPTTDCWRFQPGDGCARGRTRERVR